MLHVQPSPTYERVPHALIRRARYIFGRFRRPDAAQYKTAPPTTSTAPPNAAIASFLNLIDLAGAVIPLRKRDYAVTIGLQTEKPDARSRRGPVYRGPREDERKRNGDLSRPARGHSRALRSPPFRWACDAAQFPRRAPGRASGQLPPGLRLGLFGEHLGRPVFLQRLAHQVLLALGRHAAFRRVTVEVGREGIALR